jgi:hypothetical protein
VKVTNDNKDTSLLKNYITLQNHNVLKASQTGVKLFYLNNRVIVIEELYIYIFTLFLPESTLAFLLGAIL